jgi:hypothetical protein
LDIFPYYCDKYCEMNKMSRKEGGSHSNKH